MQQLLQKSHQGCQILHSEQLFPFPKQVLLLSSQNKEPQSNQFSDELSSVNEVVSSRWISGWMDHSLPCCTFSESLRWGDSQPPPPVLLFWPCVVRNSPVWASCPGCVISQHRVPPNPVTVGTEQRGSVDAMEELPSTPGCYPHWFLQKSKAQHHCGKASSLHPARPSTFSHTAGAGWGYHICPSCQMKVLTQLLPT